MQINGMPVSMNINLERESEALKYTHNQQCGILQLLQPALRFTALLYFKVPLLPAYFPLEPLKVTKGT